MPSAARPSFRQALARARQQPCDLAEVCFCLERDLAYLELNVVEELTRIEVMAHQLPSGIGDGLAALQRLSEVFGQRWGFRGHPGQFPEPDNSFISKVMRRRRGLPIAMCVLYQALAWRMGVATRGVCSPGHFLLRFDDAERPFFIDPFHGGQIMTQSAAISFLATMNAFQQPDPRSLEAAAVDTILYRMLNNLRPLYLKVDDWPHLCMVKRLQCELNTASVEDWIERATAEARLGARRSAADSLTRAAFMGVDDLLVPAWRAVADHLTGSFLMLQ